MYTFIKKAVAPCMAAISLSAAFTIQHANAFLAWPNSKDSIAWSYVALAQGKLNQDITFPLCLPREKVNDEDRAKFLTMTNKVANEWNEHTKSAIGAEWPINTIRFYIDVPENDCKTRSHLHESGVTIKPFTVGLKTHGHFDGGDHQVRLIAEAFKLISTLRSVYLHEFGHVLALADDYKGSYSQGGRPSSMMKMHGELQEEDKVALRFMWRNKEGYGDTQCPDTHFMIDDGYHGFGNAAGTKSCLPYLKDNIVNNPHLQQYNITNPDNCIIFMDDPNTDLTPFVHKFTQEKHRESHPQEYFAGAPTHPPICLSEKDTAGDLNPLSVFLNIDSLNKLDSMWVGKNLHINLRWLKKQENGRYLTSKESKYYYPFAWLHNEWSVYDKNTLEYLPEGFDALSISIVDKNKEMVEPNIAPLDLQRSAELNPMTWPEPEVIKQMVSQQPGNSCANLAISKSGSYMISRDALSDQKVYCELDDKAPSWTYLGFSDSRTLFKHFFHYSIGANKVEGIEAHTNEPYTAYSNGLTSKLKDNEMLIKVNDFHNGPKIYLQYDYENPLLNNMYHRICKEGKTFDFRVKIDWPDDERATWTTKERWPDNEYHDAILHCHYSNPQHLQVRLSYKDHALGIYKGQIFDIFLNLSFGIMLHNEEWTQNNPPKNQLNSKHQNSWLFVRNSKETDFIGVSKGNHKWTLNEGIGNVAVDSIGGRNGVINGADWVTTGHSDNALHFNGVSDVVEIEGPTVDTSSSFSVSSWVKLDSLKGWQTAVSQDGTNVSGFYLQKTEDGEFAFSIFENDSMDSKVVRAESSFKPAADTWYHLIGVHDAASQEIKLFVNGSLAATQAFTSPWSAIGNTTIGAAKWEGAKKDHFSGVIDEVKVYNKALTAAEAQSLYAVPGKLLFSDDFNDGNAEGWYTYGDNTTSLNDSNWQVVDEGYHVKAGKGYKAIAQTPDGFTDFFYEADVSLSAAGNAGLIFRAKDIDFGADALSGYYAGIESNGNVTLGNINRSWTLLKSVEAGIQTGATYRLKILVIGSNIRVYVNDILKINIDDSTHTSGLVGLRTFESNASFDNIIVHEVTQN